MLSELDLSGYDYGQLIYAGNRYLADRLPASLASAKIVANPMADRLVPTDESLLEEVRSLYLDDLTGRQDVAELQPMSEVPIWPTPAVVGKAYEAISRNRGWTTFPMPCIVVDIGGATTDVHFGLDVVRQRQLDRYHSSHTCNRYVFTDLGVVASEQSTVGRLTQHECLHDLLRIVYGASADKRRADLFEGEAEGEMLFYACFLLSLHAMVEGTGQAPVLDFEKVQSIVVTGGASQCTDPVVLSKIARRLLPVSSDNALDIFLDANYRIWAEGMIHVPVKD